eukprot:CAMPEP_0185361904 /NCGR_PEP_ID=MMETSP1364-20130426/10640_1 /TAXON_ID=38817 /ORGANISM="Gephyrocapsa oceanica, Strain RCC1303" /LENGTH=183 /DNA_ID=CAMNT_0027962255 /DNA_START=82 /DNA_END=631 /DNA_ORIENTATION=+
MYSDRRARVASDHTQELPGVLNASTADSETDADYEEREHAQRGRPNASYHDTAALRAAAARLPAALGSLLGGQVSRLELRLAVVQAVRCPDVVRKDVDRGIVWDDVGLGIRALGMQRLRTALLRESEPERALKLLLLYERTAPFAHGKVSGVLCVARSMENKLLVAGKVWRDPPATPRVPVAL